MKSESLLVSGTRCRREGWRRTLRQLRPVLDVLPVAVAVVHRRRIVHANPTCQQLLTDGPTSGSWRGKHLRQVLQQDNWPHVEQWLHQLALSGRAVQGKIAVPNNLGRPESLQVTFSLVDREDPQLVVATFWPDGVAIPAPQQGEEIYRLILDGVNDGIVMSQQHRFMFFNRRFAEMLGYAPEELMSMDYRKLHTERGLEIVEQRTKARERGEHVPARYETSFRRKDGSEVQVEVNVAIVNHNGHPATFAVVRDVSERKWAMQVQAAQLELAMALSGATDLRECLRLSLETALRISEMDGGWVYLVDEATGALELVYQQGLPEEFVAKVKHFGPDCANVKLVKGARSLFTSYPELARSLGVRVKAPLRAIAVVPMLHKGKVVGCLNVASRTLAEVPLRARGALHLISTQVGDAIARLRAEQALHDREEHLKAIIEGMNEGLVYCDPEGVIRFANRRFCAMVGYDHEELLGANGVDFLVASAQDRREVHAWMAACLEGEPGEHEVRLRKKSGERLWVRCVFSPVHDPEGRVVGTVALASDISEQRRALSVLSLLYNIANAAHRAATLQELCREIHLSLVEAIDTTNFFVALYDQEKNELTFPYWVDERDSYQEPLSLAGADSLCAQVIRSRCSLLVRAKDYDQMVASGQVRARDSRPLVWLGVPLLDGQEVVGVMAVQSYSDPYALSEKDAELLEVVSHQIASAVRRKRAEEELRQSEEMYRLLVENVNDAILISQDDRFVFFNPQFARLLRYEPHELLNKDYRQVYTERGIALLMERQRRRQAGEEVPSRYETTFRCKDGSEVDVEANVTIITYHGRPATFAVIRDITDQKRAQEALARLALRLKTAAEVAQAAASILDPDELIQQVVELVRERFGFHYVGLYLVDDTEEWAELRAGTGEPGRTMLAQGYRLPVKGKCMIGWAITHKQVRLAQRVDHDPVHLANRFLPEVRAEIALPLIARNEVIGAITVQSAQEAAFSEEDVVALRTMADQVATAIANARLYKALAQEQSLMRVLMDSIPDKVYFKDTQSRFMRVSRSLVERHGLRDPSQILGKTDFDFFTEEHARQAYEDEQQIIRTGQPIVGVEERETWPDGRVTWVLTSKLPMRDEEGRIIGTFGISTDITARKHMEKQLADERNLLRTIIDTVPDRIYAKDQDTRFILNNLAHLHALGVRTQAEALGRTDFDFRPQQLAERYAKQDRGVLELGQPLVHVEEQTLLPTGEPGWLLCSKVPLRDSEGNVIGVVGITRDITEQKRAQAALEASLREKEVLLKEIHHRVKNNMQVISSMLRLQSNYIDDPKILELFNETQNRVRSMALIHEQLYRSQDLAHIDFAAYVRTLAGQLARSYESSAHVTLQVEVEGITLGVDAGIPCGLIINELVSNAYKHAFSGRRSGTIWVKMQQQDDHVQLSVRDDGVGFPKEVDFRNTESLGLQLVTTLTDQLEGTIRLVSEGEGTEFIITFSVPR